MVVVVASVFFYGRHGGFLFVCVCGSIAVVGSLLNCLLEHQSRCVGRSVLSFLPTPHRGQQFFPLSSLFLTSYRVVNLHLYVLFFCFVLCMCVCLSMERLDAVSVANQIC